MFQVRRYLRNCSFRYYVIGKTDNLRPMTSLPEPRVFAPSLLPVRTYFLFPFVGREVTQFKSSCKRHALVNSQVHSEVVVLADVARTATAC